MYLTHVIEVSAVGAARRRAALSTIGSGTRKRKADTEDAKRGTRKPARTRNAKKGTGKLKDTQRDRKRGKEKKAKNAQGASATGSSTARSRHEVGEESEHGSIDDAFLGETNIRH